MNHRAVLTPILTAVLGALLALACGDGGDGGQTPAAGVYRWHIEGWDYRSTLDHAATYLENRAKCEVGERERTPILHEGYDPDDPASVRTYCNELARDYAVDFWDESTLLPPREATCFVAAHESIESVRLRAVTALAPVGEAPTPTIIRQAADRLRAMETEWQAAIETAMACPDGDYSNSWQPPTRWPEWEGE